MRSTAGREQNSGDCGSRSWNMRLQIAFGVLYFTMLVVLVTSLSNEVSLFRLVKSDDDKVLCGTSTPNKTVSAVGSRVECVSECNRGCRSPCQAVNYRQNAKLCEVFDYEPCSYDEQQDCAVYKVNCLSCCDCVFKVNLTRLSCKSLFI